MVENDLEVRFVAASDRSLLVYFGDVISPGVQRRVAGLSRALQKRPVEGSLNIHPAYTSVLVVFDALNTDHAAIQREIELRLAETDEIAPSRTVEIPVCYGAEFGPDLPFVAALSGLTPEDAAELHASAEYTAAFLGFAPGFAYLSGLPAELSAPRLDKPRQRVPAGSVGIAGLQTAVYPFATPGGWRLIGRTPLRMFQADRDPMSVVQIGDRVRFTPVSEERFRELERTA